MSAVQAPPPGPMDACNSLGVPPLKAGFGPMAGLSIFLSWLLGVLAVVAALLPWSEMEFPVYYGLTYGFKFNFGLKYWFLSLVGTGIDGFTSAGGTLYLDPTCPYVFGTMAFAGGLNNIGDLSTNLLAANLCTQCNDSNTWSFMWLSLVTSGIFMVFLSAYVACCKCICCCNLGTYSRTFLFIMGIITLGLTAGARAQNSKCDASIKAWADYILANPGYQVAFPGMKYTAAGAGSSLASGCIAMAVIMMLLTVVFPWPLGRTMNEPVVDAAQFNNDTKPPFPQAAPAYPPQQAPAYPNQA